MPKQRMISTPTEDDALWAAVEAVSKHTSTPVSRLVVQALADYAPVAMYLQAVADMHAAELVGLGLAPVDNHG